MYQHVRLMMYYIDAAGFGLAIRRSGGVESGLSEQEKGGRFFPSLKYLLRQVSLAHIRT
jgi:hypothetical protein